MGRKLTQAEKWMRRLKRLVQDQPEGTIVFVTSTGGIHLIEEPNNLDCSPNAQKSLASFDPPRPNSWQVDGR